MLGNQKRCWETRNNGKTKSEGPKLIKNDMSRTNDVRRTRSGQKTMSAKPDTVKTITGQKTAEKRVQRITNGRKTK